MAKLTKPPDQQGFSIEEQAQVAHRALPGGLSWRRLDVVGGATRFYDVAWVTGREGFQYLSDFHDENVGRNAEVFQVDLFGPTATLVEVDANFVPGSFRLESVTGHEFTVRAKLEVEPFPGEPTTWPSAWSPFFLELAPDEANYSAEPGTEVARVQHDGPAGVYRRSVLNSARRVTLLWYCTAEEYALLQQAYLAWVFAGGQAFVMELLLQSPDLVAHTCSFIPGSFRMTAVQEETYTVQAELEVLPTPYDVEMRPYTGADFGPITPSLTIGWHDPVEEAGGTAASTNSGTHATDFGAFTPWPVGNTIFCSVIDYDTGTVVWDVSWTPEVGAVGDPVPTWDTPAAPELLQISYENRDNDFPKSTSRGTLTITATVDGVPVENVLQVVTTDPGAFGDSQMTWGTA